MCTHTCVCVCVKLKVEVFDGTMQYFNKKTYKPSFLYYFVIYHVFKIKNVIFTKWPFYTLFIIVL